MGSDADPLQSIPDLDEAQHAQAECWATAMRVLADALRWMLDVAEARNGDPRARTVTLKCARPTLTMWQDKAQRALERVDRAPDHRGDRCPREACGLSVTTPGWPRAGPSTERRDHDTARVSGLFTSAHRPGHRFFPLR
jgi:hypothetical protein